MFTVNKKSQSGLQSFAPLGAIVISLASGGAYAGNFTLSAYDSGWYNGSGQHSPANQNWFAGSELVGYHDVCSGALWWRTCTSYPSYQTYRDFFAFNPASLNGRVVQSASFNTNTYNTSGSSVLSLYDVSTATDSLLGGAGGISAYADLGSGAVYGNTSINASNTSISVGFNTSGVAALNTAIQGGQPFVVGGAITAADGLYAFGGSGASVTNSLEVRTLDPMWSAPSVVSFGNVLVGRTESENVAISNIGAVGTRLIGAVSGTVGHGFMGPSANLNVAAGDSYHFVERFSAGTRGGYTQTISASVNTGSSGNVNRSILLIANAVAPVISANNTLQSKAIRVGDTDSLGNVNILNSGDGNLSGVGAFSDLLGSVNVDGAGSRGGGFFSLHDSQSKTFNITSAPTERGSSVTSVIVNHQNGLGNTNGSGSFSRNVTVTGVSPVFSSSQAGVDFGEVVAGEKSNIIFSVGNVSPDVGYVDSLAGMTLLGARISGNYANLFSLDSFEAGSILSPGEWLDLNISFSPAKGVAAGVYGAVLVLTTDVDSAFGHVGERYSFNLSGTVSPVPEPETYAMLALGLGLIGFMHKRKKALRS